MLVVKHKERYTLEPVVKYYNSASEVLEDYKTYSNLVQFHLNQLKQVGDGVSFVYDPYVELTVELVED